MQKNLISVNRTARYFTLGQPTNSLEQVWYIFHGYGQSASELLEQFAYFEKGTRYFIAPEGLSRLYVSGHSGKVGASWMTKECRENEIADYLNYINALYKQIQENLPEKEIKSVLFGFSQGVATLCRWLGQVSINADRLILWAGTIPDDVDLWRIKAHYPQLHVDLVYGTQDAFACPDVIKEQEERLQKAEMNYRKIRFDGKHEIHPPTMTKLIEY